MDFSLPGSSTHGIFQARVLEWGAIATDPRPSLNQLVAVPSISLLLLHLVMLESYAYSCILWAGSTGTTWIKSKEVVIFQRKIYQ